MEVIAHRGFLDGPAKPVDGQLNSALSHGFGVEFDMAVPDHLAYPGHGLPAYARLSEIEPLGDFALQSDGIWLDAFSSTWWDDALVARLLHRGLKVCVVSPELHRRERRPAWEALRKAGLGGHAGLSLCTDYPHEARTFFAI